jgi:FKBP-type peptidyl-prolyl cis-trans isomerase 2
MSNEGKKVRVHYIGTLDDGTVFDNSWERGEALEFVCMSDTMIPGFDKAVKDMEVGQKINIHLEPDDAYGAYNEELIEKIPFDEFPNAENLPVGKTIFVQDGDEMFPVKVVCIESGVITFDSNHPMAGKALNFDIELLDVSEPNYTAPDILPPGQRA